MASPQAELQFTLARVRRRWRGAELLRVFAAAAAASATVILAAFSVWLLLNPRDVAVAALSVGALVLAVACVVAAAWGLRKSPRDGQIARYIEERFPELEDRLATAVEVARNTDGGASLPIREHVVADALGRLRSLDVNQAVSARVIRRRTFAALGSAVLLILAAAASRSMLVQGVQTAWVYLYPSLLAFDVEPGNVTLRAGAPLTIKVHMRGASAVDPTLTVGPRAIPMEAVEAGGTFTVAMSAVDDSFTYRVTAGRATSREYRVRVLQTPRVKQIDLRYEYPKAYGMAPRIEQDGGDIYGPAGTKVRVRVQADKAVTAGEIVIADGTRLPMKAVSPDIREGEIEIVADESYRVSLSDGDGLQNAGDTEYFIRALTDRPPTVRFIRPRGDQEVTRLEEVPIVVRADDDYGIDRFELVYSVRGKPETVVRFKTGPEETTATGTKMLYLEDLKVAPGDYVTFYARVRDVPDEGLSTEVRSDIRFLTVKPYTDVFLTARTRTEEEDEPTDSLSAIIKEQREIINATWRLDRRAHDSRARSQQDIRTLADMQSALIGRIEPVGRQLVRRVPREGAPGEPPKEEPNVILDALERAGQAMRRATADLEGLRTSGALPHQVAALDQLSVAAADVRIHRLIYSTTPSPTGRVGEEDLSSLFDEQLRDQQETAREIAEPPPLMGDDNQRNRTKLNAGGDGKVPDAYQRAVDEYFESLATNGRR